jgi:transposase-like protein
MRLDNPALKDISPKTMSEMEVDFTRLVVSDEFNSRSSNYRETAINRLIESKEPFRNEHNITWEMLKRFIVVKCPYCSRDMKSNGGGASGGRHTMSYSCPSKRCGGQFSLSVDSDGAMNISKGE